MKIEADTSAARATHYSIFDRTPADIAGPDLAGNLDHLAATLDYLDYLETAQKSLHPNLPAGGATQPCRQAKGPRAIYLTAYPRGAALGSPQWRPGRFQCATTLASGAAFLDRLSGTAARP